jgi:hypothetical protein
MSLLMLAPSDAPAGVCFGKLLLLLTLQLNDDHSGNKANEAEMNESKQNFTTSSSWDKTLFWPEQKISRAR